MALPAGASQVNRSTRADPRHDRAHLHAPLIRYVIFTSLLIGACASYAATGRITASTLASLALVWGWVPLLHVLTAKLVAGERGALLLDTVSPWSLWVIVASASVGTFGWDAYYWMLALALVPIAITLVILYRFFTAVMKDSPGRAVARTLLHQGITWTVAAVYLDRAVSLWPRIVEWLS